MHARLDPVPTVDVVPLTERRGGGIERENVRRQGLGEELLGGTGECNKESVFHEGYTETSRTR